MQEILDAIVPPNKLIQAPYGTLCRVDGDDRVHMYIQVGRVYPQWVPIGDFLASVFHDQLYEQEFIISCLEKYEK